jgi:hypothetical protein
MKLYNKASTTTPSYDRNTLITYITSTEAPIGGSATQIGDIYTVPANRAANVGLINLNVITKSTPNVAAELNIYLILSQAIVADHDINLLLTQYSYINQTIIFLANIGLVLREADQIGLYALTDTVLTQPVCQSEITIIEYDA